MRRLAALVALALAACGGLKDDEVPYTPTVTTPTTTTTTVGPA